MPYKWKTVKAPKGSTHELWAWHTPFGKQNTENNKKYLITITKNINKLILTIIQQLLKTYYEQVQYFFLLYFGNKWSEPKNRHSKFTKKLYSLHFFLSHLFLMYPFMVSGTCWGFYIQQLFQHKQKLYTWEIISPKNLP